jgi:hypothetical protein
MFTECSLNVPNIVWLQVWFREQGSATEFLWRADALDHAGMYHHFENHFLPTLFE